MKINFYFDVILWYQIVIDVLMFGVIFNIYGCKMGVRINFGWEIEIYFVSLKNRNLYFYEKKDFLNK